MNKYLLALFFAFNATASFSQDSYTTLDGQKISGSVKNNREWLKNPLTVVFTKSDGSTITLTPENCKSFTAGTDNYLSYHGTRVANPANVLSSHNDEGPTMIKDTVNAFLRQVYKFDGYALYELNDNKRINFYLDKDGSIRELEYYETIKDGNVNPVNSYKAYLYQDLASRKTRNFSDKIKNLHYNENELQSFFAQVLGDQAHASEKLRNKYPSETLMGLGANAISGSIESGSNSPSYHQTTFSPSFEIGLRLYSQRNMGKFFFQPTISVMSISNNFKLEAYSIKVKASLVNANLGAGYMFLKKPKVSVYAAGAGDLSLLLNYQTQKGTAKYQSDGPDGRLTAHFEFGALLGQKLNLSIGDNLPIRMYFNSGVTESYKVSQLSLALRYTFVHGKNKM